VLFIFIALFSSCRQPKGESANKQHLFAKEYSLFPAEWQTLPLRSNERAVSERYEMEKPYGGEITYSGALSFFCIGNPEACHSFHPPLRA
jgi:hypothetical protein